MLPRNQGKAQGRNKNSKQHKPRHRNNKNSKQHNHPNRQVKQTYHVYNM